MLTFSYVILCSIITITHDISKLCHEENWFSVHAIESSATLLNPHNSSFQGIYGPEKNIFLNKLVRHGGEAL